MNDPMVVRETLVKALTYCIEKDDGCIECPYDGVCRDRPFALDSDILEYLKPVRPIKKRTLTSSKWSQQWELDMFACPRCGMEISLFPEEDPCDPVLRDSYTFCSKCGAHFDWSERLTNNNNDNREGNE